MKRLVDELNERRSINIPVLTVDFFYLQNKSIDIIALVSGTISSETKIDPGTETLLEGNYFCLFSGKL